ncbi:MAG: formylglycine-generating enzyme family protein [Nitrospinota bacterium]
MARVPAGPFLMGDWLGRPNERPPLRVHLDAFEIDIYEVTNGQYSRFMQEREKEGTPVRKPDYWISPEFNAPRQPVVGITWYEARAYCAWAGKRLPTEAEWEKAARGTDGRRYPWGDIFHAERANSALSGVDRPTPVATYPAGRSPYGLHDMAGNVWEWTATPYGEHYYRVSPLRNPQGPKDGWLKVIRGGSWMNGPDQIRTGVRFRLDPVVKWKRVGFRCARSPGL